MTPSPTLSPSDLAEIYRNRFQDAVEYRKRVWHALSSGFFSRWVKPDASVLDLGCGYCEFINSLSAAKKYAMDLNPEASSRAAAGVTVFQQDCSVTWPLADATLDAVFTSNFVEHLPTKAVLEETLQQARRCLKTGGRFIAMGPNIRYVGGAYWDFWDHYLPLTELSFAEALRKIGFELEIVQARFLPYSMSTGRRPPLWMLRVYLALRPAWRLFGKQFLIIASKR